MAPTLLHGTIYATIIEADKLQGRFSLDYLCGKVYFFFHQHRKSFLAKSNVVSWQLKTGNPQRKTKRFLGQIKRYVLCRPEVCMHNVIRDGIIKYFFEISSFFGVGGWFQALCYH